MSPQTALLDAFFSLGLYIFGGIVIYVGDYKVPGHTMSLVGLLSFISLCIMTGAYFWLPLFVLLLLAQVFWIYRDRKDF